MTTTPPDSSHLRFTKHHGAGNDFLVQVDPGGSGPLPADLVRALCDRHFGVGADLEVMARDSRLVRGEGPFLFTDCRHGVGIDAVMARLDAARAAHAAEDGRSPARAGWSTDTHGHSHAADGSHRYP